MMDDFSKALQDYTDAMKQLSEIFKQFDDRLKQIRRAQQKRLYNLICGITRSNN